MGDSMMGIGMVFIGIFLIIVSIPCVGITYVGLKLIYDLGHFPSKTPIIQMSVLLKLAIIEIISVTLLVIFYHMLSGAGTEEQTTRQYQKNTEWKVVSVFEQEPGFRLAGKNQV